MSPTSSLFPTAIPSSSLSLPPTNSLVPSINPSWSPTLLSEQYGYYSVKRRFITPFEKDKAEKSFGVMFEMVASRDLILRTMSFHTVVDAKGKVSVKVFHKPGPYKENSATPLQIGQENWNIICDITGKGMGEGAGTRVPESRFTPIKLLQGSKHSFLVKAMKPDMISGVSIAAEGEIHTSNSDIQILVGAGWNQLQANFHDRGEFLANITPQRLFEGFLYYSIPESEPPTMTPTKMLKISPTIVPTKMSTISPTTVPTKMPTISPTFLSTKMTASSPTIAQTNMPMRSPTMMPTKIPANSPTIMPTKVLTNSTTTMPTNMPTNSPAKASSINSNIAHSDLPSVSTSTSVPLLKNVTVALNVVNVSIVATDPSTNMPTKIPSKTPSISLIGQSSTGVVLTNTQSDLPSVSRSIAPTKVASTDSAFPIVVPPTLSPTGVSTLAPSAEAVRTFQANQKLQTTFEGGISSYGSMFELVALNELVVRSIECYTDLLDFDSLAEVWTRVGSFQGKKVKEGWMKLTAEDNVIEQVQYLSGTLIHISLNSPVTVKAGQTQAFLVTLRTNHLRLSNVDKVGIYVQNADMQVHVGVGVGTYRFGEVHEDQMFNGVVHYSTLHAPTKEPTVVTKAPAVSPEVGSSTPSEVPKGPKKVVTQQRIALKGVLPKFRDRTLLGRAERKMLDSAAIRFFEYCLFRFLNDALRKHDPPISINSVVVSVDPELVDDGRQLKRSLPEKMHTNSSDDANDSIEMYTTISGQYMPPPFIDFTNAVEDTFDDKQEIFIEELKQEEVFKDIELVDVVEVTFDAPTASSKLDDITDNIVQTLRRGFSNKLVILVSGASAGFALFVVVLSVFWNRMKKSEKSKRYDILLDEGNTAEQSSRHTMNGGAVRQSSMVQATNLSSQRHLSKANNLRTTSTRNSLRRLEVGDSDRFARWGPQQSMSRSERLVGGYPRQESLAQTSFSAQTLNAEML